MSIKYKAAILKQINQPLAIEEIETTPLQIGQVLVKITISGLCGAQLQEIRGEKNNAKFVPHLLGHEGCGIVQDVGPGVTKVKAGQKVILHWRKGDGIEAIFPSYNYNGKSMSSGKVTTLSEYTVASENRLTPVADDVPDELCALLGCGLSTALGTINNDAKIKFGEKVLIIGCGGVGINLVQGAQLASAGDVYAIDITEDKRDIVDSFNAIFLNYTTQKDIIDNLSKIDCIIDTTGLMDIVSEMLPKLSEHGRVIIISQPKLNSSLTFTSPGNFFLGEGQSIMSTQGGKVNPTADFPKYITLYRRGVLNIDKLITHNFRLDEINTAIEILKAGKAGRILIRMY
jgi:S-(hydroxymethyl)glutathione dehydrogenase/alcohol dehydrogenase